MSAPRRSRSERSADSRQLILDATLACLFEQGYARTTTLTIQARAGVSRGRLLHQFPSRDGLLVAACQHLVQHHLAEVESWVTSVLDNEVPDDEDPGALGDRLDRATDQLWATFQQPYFWGAIELWTAARTDAGLRETLLPQERRLGVAIRRVIDVLYGPAVTSHPGYATMRELVFSSMRGVALTYAFDQRDPACDPHLPLWREVSRRLLGAPAAAPTTRPCHDPSSEDGRGEDGNCGIGLVESRSGVPRRGARVPGA